MRRLGAVLCAIGALLLFGCESELAADLDEAQADEVVLALDEAGIGARKERSRAGGSFRVVVAREDVAPGLAVLRDQELPRRDAPGLAELFAERGLVPSAAEERARHTAAVAGELARSIESFEGVTRARVHLALPEERPLDDAPGRARASVLIAHRPGARVDEDAVRALVAGAVSNLVAEQVAIVQTEARPPRSGEARLATLGPIAVARSSVTPLKLILAASFGTNLLLAFALVFRARRPTSVHGESTHGAPTRKPPAE